MAAILVTFTATQACSKLVAMNKGRFNATRHGIFASALCNSNLLGEAQQNFDAFKKGLTRTFRPTSDFEQLQIEKLSFLYVRLVRLYKSEWEIAPKLFQRVSDILDDSREVIETACVTQGEEVAYLRREPSPELLIRYETNLERQIGRTLDLLLRFKESQGGA
jgi:hypothetical protein